MNIVLYIIFGVLAGVFGGMGLGGGTVLIPLLTIFLSVNQKLAQGYNLLTFLIMAVVAIIIHAKNKLIDLKSIIWIVVFGAVFCVGGALLTTIVDTKILKIIFAIFLILLSIWQFVSALKEKS
ncbi:MAG: sulfite exporter TauE/SafE family protein [Clostridia bacterium]|nr:sulfite exporter TauE/SafE family protein [Clostridia bacterium]MBR2221255.1 sulfite exporter TauE/SafE family protein [Clostridia bacterium]